MLSTAFFSCVYGDTSLGWIFRSPDFREPNLRPQDHHHFILLLLRRRNPIILTDTPPQCTLVPPTNTVMLTRHLVRNNAGPLETGNSVSSSFIFLSVDTYVPMEVPSLFCALAYSQVPGHELSVVNADRTRQVRA